MKQGKRILWAEVAAEASRITGRKWFGCEKFLSDRLSGLISRVRSGVEFSIRGASTAETEKIRALIVSIMELRATASEANAVRHPLRCEFAPLLSSSVCISLPLLFLQDPDVATTEEVTESVPGDDDDEDSEEVSVIVVPSALL